MDILILMALLVGSLALMAYLAGGNGTGKWF